MAVRGAAVYRYSSLLLLLFAACCLAPSNAIEVADTIACFRSTIDCASQTGDAVPLASCNSATHLCLNVTGIAEGNICKYKFKTEGEVCRAAAGVCDVEEVCNGTSPLCPADTFRVNTEECRPSAGPCDVAEFCTGSNATCPIDSFKNSTVNCKNSTGVCEADAFCSGSSATCPASFLNGTVCRNSTGPCDLAETCTGTSAACPADSLRPAGTQCRAAAGACDIPETCNGTSTVCPDDKFVAAGMVCRDSSGRACDVEERCNGTSPVCPPDTFLPSNVTCRAAAGVCDRAENCTGTSPDCPLDTFLPSTTVCRTTNGACDAEEECTGDSANCPADTYQPATAVCRNSTGPCDAAELCTGNSTTCPADQLSPAGTVCRTISGPCDVQELCNGTSHQCPADTFQPNTFVCRNATGNIPLQRCSGTAATCPTDGTVEAPTLGVNVFTSGACNDTIFTGIVDTVRAQMRVNTLYDQNVDATRGVCVQANGRRLLDASLYPASSSAGRSLLATTSTYGVNVITIGTFDRNILSSLSATFKLFSDTTNGPGGIGAAVPRLNDVVRMLSNNQAAVTGGGATLSTTLLPTPPPPTDQITLVKLGTDAAVRSIPYTVEVTVTGPSYTNPTNFQVQLTGALQGTSCTTSRQTLNTAGKAQFQCTSTVAGQISLTATVGGASLSTMQSIDVYTASLSVTRLGIVGGNLNVGGQADFQARLSIVKTAPTTTEASLMNYPLPITASPSTAVCTATNPANGVSDAAGSVIYRCTFNAPNSYTLTGSAFGGLITGVSAPVIVIDNNPPGTTTTTCLKETPRSSIGTVTDCRVPGGTWLGLPNRDLCPRNRCSCSSSTGEGVCSCQQSGFKAYTGPVSDSDQTSWCLIDLRGLNPEPNSQGWTYNFNSPGSASNRFNSRIRISLNAARCIRPQGLLGALRGSIRIVNRHRIRVLSSCPTNTASYAAMDVGSYSVGERIGSNSALNNCRTLADAANLSYTFSINRNFVWTRNEACLALEVTTIDGYTYESTLRFVRS